MRKILTTLIILFFVTNVFSAIGYEHFTVQENQVYIELLVNLSKEFSALEKMVERVSNQYVNFRSPINGLLKSYLESESYLDNILIFDEQGRIVSAASSYAEPTVDIPDGKGWHLTVPVKTNQSDTPLMYISQSIQDQTGWTIGKAVMSIDPVEFGVMVHSIMAGFDIDLVVTDLSGTIIYDADLAEIGRNTLTDPLYQHFPELLELFQQHIAVEKRGESAYSFYATGMGSTEKKYVMWNTIEAFGTQIKVCMITK